MYWYINPPPCRRARSGVVANLSFGLPVRWCAVCWSAVCRSAVCILQILYRGPPPQIPASPASPAAFFSHLFFMLLSNTFLETLWASKNEYSCELGPQNDSKMEPKIEEKSNFVKK